MDDDAEALRALLYGPCQCDHRSHPSDIRCQGDALVIRATTDGMPWWLTIHTNAMLDYARRHQRLVGLCASCALYADTAQLSAVRRGQLLAGVLAQLLCLLLGLTAGYAIAPHRLWLNAAAYTIAALMVAVCVLTIRSHIKGFRPIDGGPADTDGSPERIDNP